jgi:hypothetical protein
MMGLPGPYAGWGLTSVYLVAVLIFWTAVIAGLLAVIRRFDAGHDPAPVSGQRGRPKQRKAA